MADQHDTITTLEEATKAATRIAMDKVLLEITRMPPVLVIPFMQALVVISVNLMRDNGRQDQYVRDMLTAALASLDAPPAMAMKDLRVN